MSWGLMYKGYIRTKKWRTHFFTSTIRCIRSEMTVEVCGASSRAVVRTFLQLLILWRHLEVMLGNCYNK